ncbi:MAG: hypothetical protein V3S52_03165 [Gemmatimonadota bacterium]
MSSITSSTRRPTWMPAWERPGLIDWGTTESPARAAPKGCMLLRLRAEHPDPARIGEMLLALGVELAVELGRAPALIATIGTARGEVGLR